VFIERIKELIAIKKELKNNAVKKINGHT